MWGQVSSAADVPVGLALNMFSFPKVLNDVACLPVLPNIWDTTRLRMTILAWPQDRECLLETVRHFLVVLQRAKCFAGPAFKVRIVATLRVSLFPTFVPIAPS